MLISYYDGAYGPTLRIHTNARDNLEALRRLLAQLASGALADADLCAALSCELDSLRGLSLRAVERRPAKTVKLAASGIQPPTFLWSNTPEDWLDHAERVDALIAGNNPGHQYLSDEGVDDALIEVSYLE